MTYDELSLKAKWNVSSGAIRIAEPPDFLVAGAAAMSKNTNHFCIIPRILKPGEVEVIQHPVEFTMKEVLLSEAEIVDALRSQPPCDHTKKS